MSSTNTGMQGLQEGEGEGGGGAGAVGVSWADVAAGEQAQDAIPRSEQVTMLHALLKQTGGVRKCTALCAKDSTMCTSAGALTNGNMFVCRMHKDRKFLTVGGPAFAETVDELLGSASKEEYRGGTPDQRKKLADMISRMSPSGLNADSATSGLHLQKSFDAAGGMTTRSASAATLAPPDTTAAGSFKSAPTAALEAVRGSRPLVEHQAVDADVLLPGMGGSMARVEETGGTDGAPKVVNAGLEGRGTPPLPTIVPSAVVQGDGEAKQEELNALEARADAELEAAAEAFDAGRRSAAEIKFQLAARFRAEAAKLNITTPSTMGQSGMNNQQGESAATGRGVAAQTSPYEAADAARAAAAAHLAECQVEVAALRAKLDERYQMELVETPLQKQIAYAEKMRMSLSDLLGKHAGAGGRGGEAGGSGSVAWGTASGGGEGVAGGVRVAGPPQGEAGGMRFDGMRAPLASPSPPPDTPFSNTVFDPMHPFTTQHREGAASEDTTLMAMGQFMASELSKHLIGKGTQTYDGRGSTIWNKVLSGPLVKILTVEVGFYISTDAKELSKTNNTAVKAAHALVKAFGETQGTGEAAWFKMRTDERASKVGKEYAAEGASRAKAGHLYEADVMTSLAEWWDRLSRTIVTLMATTKMVDTGKAIIAQQLEAMNQCLRDPNRLTTMLSSMRVTAGLSPDGPTLFELNVKSGGPTAAALAAQLTAMEQQLTKQASSTRADGNKATDAIAKAKSSATAEISKQTTRIEKLQTRLEALQKEKDRASGAERTMKERLNALEKAAAAKT